MRVRLPWVIGLLFLVALPCTADPPAGYPFVAYDEGLRLAGAQNRRVFVYLGRHGCTWCDMTNRRAFTDPEVRRRYVDHYVLVYVDAESGRRLTLPSGERVTEAEMGRRLNAFATPLFVFLDRHGTRLGSSYGVKTVADLLAMDRYVSEGHHAETTLRQYLKGAE